jgi:hypothetical protein
VTSPLSGRLVRTHRWRRWARPPSLDLYLLLVDGVPVKVVSGQPVVGVRVVDAGCREVVEPLARACLRLGDADDVQTSGPPKRVICTARVLVRSGPALVRASACVGRRYRATHHAGRGEDASGSLALTRYCRLTHMPRLRRGDSGKSVARIRTAADGVYTSDGVGDQDKDADGFTADGRGVSYADHQCRRHRPGRRG